MPATHHLEVVAVDEKGAALNVSTVTLTSGLAVSRSVAVSGAVRIALSGVNPGRGEVCFSFVDRPDFILPLTFVKGTEGPVPTFPQEAPLCCPTIQRTQETALGAAKTVFTLTLTLASAHSEVVLVAGWDYSGGANNVAYCNTCREDLYSGSTHRTGMKTTIPKRIDTPTVVTLFDFKSGERSRSVKSASGWFDLDRVLQGTVKPHVAKYSETVNQKRRHDDDSISILHVYDYLAELGLKAPGALREFHLFSHAWAGGPILANTTEDIGYRSGGTSAALRDPGDKDPRLKDFDPVNMPRLADLKAAFATDSVVKVWGCLATTAYRNLIRATASAKSDTDTVTYDWSGTKVTKTAAESKTYLRDVILKYNYMEKLSAAIGGRAKVYGAPPGMGANLRAVPVGKKTFNYMYVDGTIYKREYDFLKSAMGLVPDDTGYLFF
ncbi:hypothetical protein [Corallococcus sp. AB045]|uniref:hypothetical protein n=1 Tax=Corallococcus sp. AB045 TaxID=2316719 RepID=UPI0011C3D6E3|nr:hypothetical protein [Corallococcus sp. AB045]